MQRLRLINLRTKSAIAMVKVPLGQEGWLSVEMAEDALVRCFVAPFASVRSCEEAVAVFECIEGALQLIVSNANPVRKACLTLSLPPDSFGARFRLTASHGCWKEEAAQDVLYVAAGFERSRDGVVDLLIK